MANFSKFLSLISGADRTVDLSLSSNTLELGGGLQMDGSTSGHVVINASATTTTYALIWPAAQAASAGYILTNDGTGVLSWAPPAATGANTALSNLSAVAINTSLLPGVDDSINLGSSAFRWANVHALNNLLYGSSSGVITQEANSSTTSYTIKWPAAQAAGSNYVLANDGSGNLTWISSSTGSVTSVAFADDSSTPIYSVSGSPVTSSGTLAITLNTQAANTVFAGPSSGSAAQPGFRSLVANDIPSLSAIYLPLAGGTMSGAINMNSNKITNVANGTSAGDAVNYGQLENALAGLTYRPSVTLFDNVDTTLPTTTATLIDGTTVTNGATVLFVNLSSNNNEVYTAAVSGSAITWTARIDLDRSSAAPVKGDNVEVLSGTTYSDSQWVYNGTSFVQFNGGNQIQVNSPLSKSGNTISLGYDNATIEVNGSNQLYVPASGIGTTQLASSSVTAAKIATTAVDQVTILGGAGTALSVARAPAIVTSEVAGQTLSATTLVALRYALSTDSGSTAGQMWKADNNAATTDNFYVIGLAYPAASVAVSGTVTVVEHGIINVPGHGFTTGAPLYLGSAGALTSTPPTATSSAVVRVGQVKDANNIWVNPQVVAVN